MQERYDIVVVGAGHAGCEAACAAAQMGARTLLITMDMNKIAQMSCNPAVGGIAKGQIVREIDALGGHMGQVTDRTTLQFRMLNRSKGPAMWSPRAQCDRGRFIWAWRQVVENQQNLSIWQDQVRELLVENGQVKGVETYLGMTFLARCVIITAGTFLNGLMHIGRTKLPGGRCAEPPSLQLSESIARHGITLGRMKTGTPVRIDGRSVHFEDMTLQPGDHDFHRFSYLPAPAPSVASDAPVPSVATESQLPCWITYTNPAVHERLRQGLPDSPLYNGQIQSIGPRYCPSIETKLVTFADKEQHQLFLEPEGRNTQEYYLNGFSSSLPIDVQVEALRLIPAFRDIKIYRPGYAIEYDYFDPTLLHHTLESKKVDGLFLAGQVNGTTGYEEAAGQGLVAGVNAALKCSGGGEFVMHRDESYIGVLIDDLVTKGTNEPYRIMTSRAEYRLVLRQDNADTRLTPLGRKIGLVSDERWERFQKSQTAVDAELARLKTATVSPAEANPYLESLGSAPTDNRQSLADLLKRPEVTYENLAAIDPDRPVLSDHERSKVEVELKYAGYIEKQLAQIERFKKLEDKALPADLDYLNMDGLRIEARQKLDAQRPLSVGQASRISGVSPADIGVLLVTLEKMRRSAQKAQE